VEGGEADSIRVSPLRAASEGRRAKTGIGPLGLIKIGKFSFVERSQQLVHVPEKEAC